MFEKKAILDSVIANFSAHLEYGGFIKFALSIRFKSILIQIFPINITVKSSAYAKILYTRLQRLNKTIKDVE